MAVSTQRGFFTWKTLFGVFLAVPAIIAVVWDEVLLAGPIVFLIELGQYIFGDVLGFIIAYLVFCIIWALIGLSALWLMTRNKAEQANVTETAKPKNWRERFVFRAAKIAKLLGVLVAMVILGPVFGWPAFRMLGYTKKEVVNFTLMAAWIFGAIWVPFYGGLWNFGIGSLA